MSNKRAAFSDLSNSPSKASFSPRTKRPRVEGKVLDFGLDSSFHDGIAQKCEQELRGRETENELLSQFIRSSSPFDEETQIALKQDSALYTDMDPLTTAGTTLDAYSFPARHISISAGADLSLSGESSFDSSIFDLSSSSFLSMPTAARSVSPLQLFHPSPVHEPETEAYHTPSLMRALHGSEYYYGSQSLPPPQREREMREFSREPTAFSLASLPSPFPYPKSLRPAAIDLDQEKEASIREWMRTDSSNSFMPESPRGASGRSTNFLTDPSHLGIENTSASRDGPTVRSSQMIPRRQSLRRKTKDIRAINLKGLEAQPLLEPFLPASAAPTPITTPMPIPLSAYQSTMSTVNTSTTTIGTTSTSASSLPAGCEGLYVATTLPSPRTVVRSSIASLQGLLDRDALDKVRRTDYALKRIVGAARALEVAVEEKEKRVGFCRRNETMVIKNQKKAKK
ncbi:hypothetical protein BT69DRAFT_1283384 [Atractiella rhizophila]|nr:hypothetical protein BT69DRAFT_1283384 [Atractiella rhizophila]